MARLDIDLTDVNENDARGSWRAHPAGEYPCEVTESEYKETRKGDGMILTLKVAMLEKGLEGKFFFDNLTIKHSNPKSEQIGLAQLKELAIACGLANPDRVENSEEFHGLPILVKLDKVRDPAFGDETGYKNRVIAYKPVSQRRQAQDDTGAHEPPPHTDADIPF